ncbi:MAG TPA: cation diffusion facilitator family transporter [Candidatus Binatia bacterium]|nr:cation diffusion facilitator family transporter [Candidatus Binatia bacterium]
MHSRTHDRQALRLALVLTLTLFVVELVGGYLTNSLALLADAAHMFADVSALALAFGALWISSRAASDTKTFGYYRVEILAALVNGLFLWLVVVFIGYEASQRYAEPPPVKAEPMMVVAAIGLAVNVVCAWQLRPAEHSSMNLHGAFLHVVSDLLGSIGALLAGAVMLTTGWYVADPLISAGIGLLILYSSWGLIRDAVDVLMEAVPPHVDLDELRRALGEVPGTVEVHDLHVWTLTTGREALSAHAVVSGDADHDAVLDAMQQVSSRFHIDHVTIQIETTNRKGHEPVHF